MTPNNHRRSLGQSSYAGTADLPYGFPPPLLELDQWSMFTQRGLTCPDHGTGCNDCKRYFGHLPPPGREPQFETALKEAITVRQRTEYEHFRRFEKGEEDRRFQEYEQQRQGYEQRIQGYEEKIRDLEDSMEELSAKFARERKYGEKDRTERHQARERINELENELGVARRRVKELERGKATEQMGNLNRGEPRTGSYAQASTGQSRTATDSRPVTNVALRPESMQRSTSGQKRTRSHYEETVPPRGEPLETVNSERPKQSKEQPRVRLPGPSHEQKDGPSRAKGTEATLTEPAPKKKRTLATMTVTTKPRPVVTPKTHPPPPPPPVMAVPSTSGLRELTTEEREAMECEESPNRPRYEPGVNKGWDSQSEEWEEEETEPIKDWDVNKVALSKMRAHNRQITQTGVRPENMVITVDANARPLDGSIQECDVWFNFVPETEDQAWVLMKEATDEQAGALARVKNLIRQMDTNKDLFILKGMASIKRNWRNPGKRAMKGGPSGTTRELETTSETGAPAATNTIALPQAAAPAAVEEANPQLPMPEPTASAEEWLAYYKSCRKPSDIPSHVKRNADGTFVFSDVQGHAIMERYVPRKALAYPTICYRRQFTTLFAVPGLYAALINHSGAQPKPEEEWSATYPDDLEPSELDVPKVALWLRENGLADEDVPYLEQIGPRARQSLDDNTKSRQEDWLSHPRVLKHCIKKYNLNKEGTANSATTPKPQGTRPVKGKGKEKSSEERSGSVKINKEPVPNYAAHSEDDRVSLE